MRPTTYKLKQDKITHNWYVQGQESGKGLFVVPGTVESSRDKAINSLKILKG